MFWDAVNETWTIYWDQWCLSTYGEPEPPSWSWHGRMVEAFGTPTGEKLNELRAAEAGFPNSTTQLRRWIYEHEQLSRLLQMDEVDDPDPEVLADVDFDAEIEEELR